MLEILRRRLCKKGGRGGELFFSPRLDVVFAAVVTRRVEGASSYASVLRSRHAHRGFCVERIINRCPNILQCETSPVLLHAQWHRLESPGCVRQAKLARSHGLPRMLFPLPQCYQVQNVMGGVAWSEWSYRSCVAPHHTFSFCSIQPTLDPTVWLCFMKGRVCVLLIQVF
jgi:hypothetical protein